MSGAVNPQALARIIEVNRKADLAALVIARMTFSRGADGKYRETYYRETFHYRAEKAARKTVHVAHSFWLAGMGLFFGRWA